MTREEKLRKVLDKVLWTHNASDENKDVLVKAIVEALEQEPTTKNNPVTDIIKNLEQMLYTESISIFKRFSSPEIATFTATIKTLQYIQNNEPILDKIRKEIMHTGAYEQEVNGKTEFLKGIDYCLDVIDKYMARSEEV